MGCNALKLNQHRLAAPGEQRIFYIVEHWFSTIFNFQSSHENRWIFDESFDCMENDLAKSRRCELCNYIKNLHYRCWFAFFYLHFKHWLIEPISIQLTVFKHFFDKNCLQFLIKFLYVSKPVFDTFDYKNWNWL